MENRFSDHVSDQLKVYVYRLIDPRNGETFYIGKGKRNRVFDHAAGQQNLLGDEDKQEAKIKRIREILNAGFAVGHVIHRHGLDDTTAMEVEAALIDAYQGITNVQGGYESDDRGVMHAQEVIRQYEAEDAQFTHSVVLINVNKSAGEDGRDLYDAVRYAWKISPEKAEKAEYVLAVQQGLIKDAFVVDEWLPATQANFPGFPGVEGRYGFKGKAAPEEIRKLYRHKRVPDAYRKRGAANPIRYVEGS